jgi:hypothetical protein
LHEQVARAVEEEEGQRDAVQRSPVEMIGGWIGFVESGQSIESIYPHHHT